jgi:hypothetical protein
MEPECSLLCSQGPITGSYPKPVQSIVYLKFTLILSSHLCLGNVTHICVTNLADGVRLYMNYCPVDVINYI